PPLHFLRFGGMFSVSAPAAQFEGGRRFEAVEVPAQIKLGAHSLGEAPPASARGGVRQWLAAGAPHSASLPTKPRRSSRSLCSAAGFSRSGCGGSGKAQKRTGEPAAHSGMAFCR